MKNYFFIILLLLPAGLIIAEDKWNPRLNLEYQGGESRTLGRASVTYPLYQDPKQMIFTDFRFMLDDNENREGNLGLAWRRIFQEKFIWGLYAFGDRRRSEFENNFNQLTLGTELLTDTFEFRANYYLPETDKKAISNQSFLRFVNQGGNLFAARETVTAFEQALPGFDVEAGYGFHIRELDRLWFYGGYFNFDDSGFREVSGATARAKYEWHNPFDFTGTRVDFGFEYRNDNVRGTNRLLSVTLSIPFGKVKAAERFETLSPLDIRMMTPIMRDVDIVSGAQDLRAAIGSEFGPEVTNLEILEQAFKVSTLSDSEPQALKDTFDKVLEVFGIKLYFTDGASEAKAVRAANILAQYIDNDGDGRADNLPVLQALQADNGGIMMFQDSDELETKLGGFIGTEDEVYFHKLQDLQADEVRENGVGGEFDGSLEELLHLITQRGYGNWNPADFAEEPSSTLARLHDESIAKGNYIVAGTDVEGLPDSYTEYIYWGLTSILGAQDFTGRFDAIKGEWKLNTADKLRAAEPEFYNFLTSEAYRLPTRLPDGTYTVE